MTITEVKQALGSWSIRLLPETPRAILDALTYFGHIAVLPNRMNPVEYGDALLPAARYVGVLRKRDAAVDFTLSGSGMAFWLGDESDKGDVFESGVTLTAQTFAQSVTALLPASGAVIAGTLNSVAGTYTGIHKYQTPRQALTYVTDVFGAEWRVNGNGTLDAGTISQLYVTTPKALIMRRQDGRDLSRTALPGNMALETDLNEYTTRVLLLAEGEEGALVTGSAQLGSVPYKNLFGGDVKMTRLVSESDTAAGNANTRAQLILNLFSSNRKTVTLSTDAYDVKGEFAVGDAIDVWDVDSGFYDPAREINWEGSPINPMSLRCVELTWPLPADWTVGFRDINGVWYDLSPYYIPEGGETQIVVGAIDSSLVDVGSQPVSTRNPVADSSVPGSPTFTGFSTGSYKSDSRNTVKAVIRAEWSTPLNVGGSTIVDGDHYEIRYRVNAILGYQISWDVLSASYDWDELGSWDGPISDPVQASPQWLTAFVGWGTNNFTITELTPGVQYEIQIRAVDSARPPNQGAWSASSFVNTLGDLIAPSTPAAPTVVQNPLAIQVTHQLGKATGGTFNLEPDLDHLEVHVGGYQYFFPDNGTKVGELIATVGNILGKIPVVGTFTVKQTDGVWIKIVAVDRDGNKSGGSAAVQGTPGLITSQYVSEITASKISAGTMTASVVNAGRITTSEDGQRAELNASGLELYNAANLKTAVVGEINPDDYGIALVNDANQLTRLSDLVFGPKTAFDSSGGERGSSSYGDLAEAIIGPSVEVFIGETGRCIVFIEVMITWNTGYADLVSFGGRASVRLSGENAISPLNMWSVGYEHTIDLQEAAQTPTSSAFGFFNASGIHFFTGLNPGLTRFKMEYADTPGMSSGGATYQNRKLVVLPY